HLGPQLGPRPRRHTARHLLAAALGLVIAQGDPVVRRRDLQEARPGNHVAQAAEELVRPGREVAPDLDERHDLPVVAQRRVERRERVRDAPPLLDRRLGGVAPVDRIPHHRADHAEPFHKRPQVCLTTTAAAPYSPPSCAASYTTWAVIFERSPFTYPGSDVSAPGLIPSTARAAIAGPDAYASRQPSLPHLQRRPITSMVMCPISPARSDTPR